MNTETTLAAIRAQVDRAAARLDSYAETEKDAYRAYMDRQSNAWKDQDQVEPRDRLADVLNAKIDQMGADLASAANAGETGAGYVAMLEERADSLGEEVDAYIEAKKGRASESQIRATGDAAYQSRMDRLSSAWKDSDEKSEKEKQAESRKRLKEEQEAREFKPVFSGDAQSTLDAAFKAKQQRTANAWKDGQQAHQEPAAAPDLRFGCK
ncbi:hypothetical protein [Stutzerimonas kunmingensis]|uniref:hypothetical protein n=1 Tax=Stutzerimonas kunmingensis TaxID=1211807 RepID=UPI0028A6CEF2|nr:hypothetical protein [Stutzerimonas kunmingensis]